MVSGKMAVRDVSSRSVPMVTEWFNSNCDRGKIIMTDTTDLITDINGGRTVEMEEEEVAAMAEFIADLNYYLKVLEDRPYKNIMTDEELDSIEEYIGWTQGRLDRVVAFLHHNSQEVEHE